MDGNSNNICNWLRYNPFVIPELFISDIHNSDGINNILIYIFSSVTILIAILNVLIAVCKKTQLWPGSFITNDSLYIKMVFFGYITIFPKSKIYLVLTGKM